MGKHKTIREGDEYACSCGMRWGIDEQDPHPLLSGDGDCEHELFTDEDFTTEELLRGGELVTAVVENGRSVCKNCGSEF